MMLVLELEDISRRPGSVISRGERGNWLIKFRVFEKAAISGEGRPVKTLCSVNKYPKQAE
jgi:hypothetical protein